LLLPLARLLCRPLTLTPLRLNLPPLRPPIVAPLLLSALTLLALGPRAPSLALAAPPLPIAAPPIVLLHRLDIMNNRAVPAHDTIEPNTRPRRSTRNTSREQRAGRQRHGTQ
jgi:hypothetical protein